MTRYWSLNLLVAASLVWLAISPGLAQPGSGAPARLEQLAAATLAPETLPKMLTEGAAALEVKIKPLSVRQVESQRQLDQAGKDLKDLQVGVASLRATLAVARPPMTQIQELLATYALLATQVEGRAKDLAAESESLKNEIAVETKHWRSP